MATGCSSRWDRLGTFKNLLASDTRYPWRACAADELVTCHANLSTFSCWALAPTRHLPFVRCDLQPIQPRNVIMQARGKVSQATDGTKVSQATMRVED
mmetsp:Transcript_7816/g.17235  ORF Transcript_7816/g.17235 Transcript_7816/m.17235 type:complete len:98 (-) Transcript_7816:575-868(-)